jgi:hypothetical protein
MPMYIPKVDLIIVQSMDVPEPKAAKASNGRMR